MVSGGERDAGYYAVHSRAGGDGGMPSGYETATAVSTPFVNLTLSKNLTGTNNVLGSISFVNSSLGAGEKRLALISVDTDGATNKGRIEFHVFDGVIDREAITIKSNSAVGIGDNTPEAKLDIGGGTATYIDGIDDLLVKDDLEVDGSFFLRQVNDDAMDATNGTEGEMLYNRDDNIFYGCTVTGTPATWAAFH